MILLFDVAGFLADLSSDKESNLPKTLSLSEANSIPPDKLACDSKYAKETQKAKRDDDGPITDVMKSESIKRYADKNET